MPCPTWTVAMVLPRRQAGLVGPDHAGAEEPHAGRSLPLLTGMIDIVTLRTVPHQLIQV